MGLHEELYLWRPGPEKWCLLEVICHLYDEEREDFRARTRHVLETPETPMPPIDPVGWVKDRSYMQQDFTAKLGAFLEERAQSVNWLQSLHTPQWGNIYEHPKLGSLSAKMFLSNWLVHDYIHIRQILKIKFSYFQQLTGEQLSYAGDW